MSQSMSPPSQSERARARLRRARVIGLTAAGVLAVVLGSAFALIVRGETPELPVLGEMPEFELVTHRGEPIGPEDLAGQPLIANFVFTRCPTVCPVFSMKMQRLQERTADLGPALQLLSFSVDPAHDTPEVLAAYAERYEADPARWTFLTGDVDEMRRTVRGGLHIAMEPGGELPDGGQDILHSTHFVLFDAELRVRGYYDSNDLERIDELVRDARRLVRVSAR
jgi:protein SCO1